MSYWGSVPSCAVSFKGTILKESESPHEPRATRSPLGTRLLVVTAEVSYLHFSEVSWSPPAWRCFQDDSAPLQGPLAANSWLTWVGGQKPGQYWLCGELTLQSSFQAWREAPKSTISLSSFLSCFILPLLLFFFNKFFLRRVSPFAKEGPSQLLPLGTPPETESKFTVRLRAQIFLTPRMKVFSIVLPFFKLKVILQIHTRMPDMTPEIMQKA